MYCFHLPEAGELATRTLESGGEVIRRDYSSSGNAVIEAGYSHIDSKRITCGRLYSISGYYNENDEWVPRPSCMEALYKALVRKAKKIAPYTELTDIMTKTAGEKRGEVFEYKRKEYITAYCLELREKGYLLC